MTALPALHTAADVAAALGATDHYVKERCRRHEWPHRRMARGEVRFTADDYAQILELVSVAAAQPAEPRMSFAPRSRRAS